MVEEESSTGESLDLTPVLLDLSTGAVGYSAYSCPQVQVAASSGLMFNLDCVRQMQNKRVKTYGRLSSPTPSFIARDSAS